MTEASMNFRSYIFGAIALIMCFVLVGCAGQKPRIAKFKEVTYAQVDGWDDDDHYEALQSFKHSCEMMNKIDYERKISKFTELGGLAVDWQVPCMEAEYVAAHDAKHFFERWFKPYQVFDDEWKGEGTLTGYFHIELEGSKKKHGKYKYPVYKAPRELAQMKGSDGITHEAINNGALSNKGLELAYVDNRARLYSMHIQGSGIVKLKEGNHVNLGFADHNGYRFTGISKTLKEMGRSFRSDEEMMEWLHEHPVEAKQIIESDPSYVFFQKREGVHAYGGQGTPLRAERSMAVDYGLYPYGMPLWVSSKLPDNVEFGGREYKRLFIAQDTGGAIRGAIRGDVFFGRGKAAEKVARRFKVKTKFYALFPRTVKVPEEYIAKPL